MSPRHTTHAGTTHDAAKVRVVVTDALGLQRVLTLLTGRHHAFTRLSAEEAGTGRWTVGVDLLATPDEVDLVVARLHRLPCVLTVDVTLAGRLASTA
ncbi:hypothetical protein GCM10023328_40870 [Modestobacter marinus]|uniref:ACT domain-containing protein n=1 Tax=Modestobacter marinus TaxID=477641 RepID=A0A846M258_9ACTN|nr:hypothetical protein [Modestobacter marinus]NIH68610.1 hypothetical protein [Modestobacter marinus]GGL58621.1 hypothetical protein GCM10011589_13320 [Modestobacter marinus]